MPVMRPSERILCAIRNQEANRLVLDIVGGSATGSWWRDTSVSTGGVVLAAGRNIQPDVSPEDVLARTDATRRFDPNPVEG